MKPNNKDKELILAWLRQRDKESVAERHAHEDYCLGREHAIMDLIVRIKDKHDKVDILQWLGIYVKLAKDNVKDSGTWYFSMAHRQGYRDLIILMHDWLIGRTQVKKQKEMEDGIFKL